MSSWRSRATRTSVLVSASTYCGSRNSGYAGIITRSNERPGTCDRQRRSEEHTSELQSLRHLVCRLLLEKKKKKQKTQENDKKKQQKKKKTSNTTNEHKLHKQYQIRRKAHGQSVNKQTSLYSTQHTDTMT